MSSFSSIRIPLLGRTHAGQLAQNLCHSSAQSTPQLSDEDLIAALAGDDRSALSELFKRYARLIRTVGRRILRDGSEADDLVQDVFLYLHRKHVLFNASKGCARSWIMQVAYTQAFIRRRHLKSHGFYDSGIACQDPDFKHPVWIDPLHDRTVEGLFGSDGWKKILEQLTEDQRETLRLHFFEGYTFTEIAEKLGQSYANVRNHHYRGLEKIRGHLTEDELNRR